MQTFLIERVVPPSLQAYDPAVLALHCRWAADAYRAVGAFWLGGVITDDGMFALVSVEDEADLRTYWRSIGVADDEVKVRRVLAPTGPFLAAGR